jgi:hypothetical protein
MPKAAVKGNVVPFRRRKNPLTPARALALLREKEVIEVPSVAALGELLGWERTRAAHTLRRWEKALHVNVERDARGGVTVRARPADAVKLREFGPGENRDKPTRRKRSPGRPKKRKDARPRARQTVHPEHSAERENTSTSERENRRENEREVSRGFEREIDRENSPNPDAPPTVYQNKETPESTPEYLHETALGSTPGATSEAPAETRSVPPVAPHQEGPPTANLPADGHVVVRPKGGGGGPPGFDAVDAFRKSTWAERLLILIAGGLSGTAAYMSVTGMVVMFPVEPGVIMVFGGLIELAKFFGFGVLAAGWKAYSPLSRWAAALLLLIAALINAGGVYGRLIANHVGVAADRTATYATRDAGEGAKLEVASAKLADIDRRIALIDGAAEGAAKRGRSKSALSAIEAQKRQRAALVSERERVAREVADLKAGRSGLAARHEADEAAATPVRYAAALFEDFGLLKPGTDPEKLIRWLSFMILLSGDPLALALMVAINSRARRQGGA